MTAYWWSSAAFVGAACLCSCQLVSGLSDLEAAAGAGGAASAQASVSAASATTSGSGGAGGAVTCMGDICVEEFVSNTGVEVRYLALDFGSLYWCGEGTASQGSAIYRRSLITGEEPVVVAFEARPLGLAVDPVDKLVFWPESMEAERSIQYAAADGKDQTGLTAYLEGGHPMDEWYGLTYGTASQLLFWGSRLTEVLYGGTSVAMGVTYMAIPSTSTRTRAIATDDDFVYYVGQTGLSKALPDGSFVEMIAMAVNNTHGIAVDGANVYWTVRDAFGSVRGAPKASKDGSITGLSDEVFPSSIAQDGQSLYWAVDGADDCHAGSGSVRRTKLGLLGADAIVTLATEQVCPTNFVVGEEHVYWGSGTKIYRVAK